MASECQKRWSFPAWRILGGLIEEACLTVSAFLALALLVLLGSRATVRFLGFLWPATGARQHRQIRVNHPLLWSR